MHSVGEQGKLVYIVMDLVEGPTLDNYLSERSLSAVEIAALFQKPYFQVQQTLATPVKTPIMATA